MARITVTNNLTDMYLVPAPIRALLRGGETRVFDNILLSDINRSYSFLSAVEDGTITVAATEDPAVPNDLEAGARTVDGSSLADASVTTAKLHMFLSAVRTGTGAAENVAHGLTVVPSSVIIVPVGGHDGLGAAGTQFPTIAEGAHDATNVVVTVTAGAQYQVLAIA